MDVNKQYVALIIQLIRNDAIVTVAIVTKLTGNTISRWHNEVFSMAYASDTVNQQRRHTCTRWQVRLFSGKDWISKPTFNLGRKTESTQMLLVEREKEKLLHRQAHNFKETETRNKSKQINIFVIEGQDWRGAWFCNKVFKEVVDSRWA